MLRQKPILGWILYDIASSGYIMMIPGIAYPVFFRQLVCGGEAICDGRWALWVSLALIVSGALAPFLGAIADVGSLRHRFFGVTTLICGVATLTLTRVQPGNLVWGGMVFFLAQTAYLLAISLYDAYLPALVPPHLLGKLSGWGWGLGYLGGIVCYLVFWLLQASHRFDDLREYHLAFAVVGVFFLVFSVPALAWLPRQSQPPKLPISQLISQSYGKVRYTWVNLGNNQNVWHFLAGFYLISAVIVTLNNFFAIYLHTQFGLTFPQILRLNLWFNLISLPSTIAFGVWSSHWSFKAVLRLLLGIWAIFFVLMIGSTHPTTPLILAILLGLVFGATQSLCRGWFAQMVETTQASELFGFNALVQRISSIFVPLLFGGISAATGNQRLALLALGLFLGLGGIILNQMPTLKSDRPSP